MINYYDETMAEEVWFTFLENKELRTIPAREGIDFSKEIEKYGDADSSNISGHFIAGNVFLYKFPTFGKIRDNDITMFHVTQILASMKQYYGNSVCSLYNGTDINCGTFICDIITN